MFRTLCPSVLSASLSDLYISMSDCPRRRIVSAGTNFEPLNPKFIALKDAGQIRADPLSQTRPDLHHHPRRGGEEQSWRRGSAEWSCAIEADP